MASSDSEDFESADEDLEIRNTSKSQDHRKKQSQSTSGKIHDKGPVDLTCVSKLVIESDSTIKVTSNETVKATGIKDTIENVSMVENLANIKLKHIDTQHGSSNKIKLGVKIDSGAKTVSTHNILTDSEKGAETSECTKNMTLKEDSETLHIYRPSKVEGWEDEVEELSQKVLDTSDEKLNSYQLPKAEGWEDEVEELSQEVLASDEKLGSVFDKLTKSSPEKDSSSGAWSSWGNWGGSLLSTATESVTTLTSHVSQGLSNVLETGIGAPDPEELARLDLQEKQDEETKTKISEPHLKPEETVEKTLEKPVETEESTGMFGFGRVMSGVTSITKLVETTGSKVLSGGLGTLETIGKKTMEVLQEGDPGLKKKRALFTDKTVLSQILREAKDKAELDDRELKDKEAARKAHFETLFDDYQGLVHLEALEMLSKQCDMKLQAMLLSSSGPQLLQLQQSFGTLKEQCQLQDEEEGEEAGPEWVEKLIAAEKQLGVHLPTDKLVKTWEETDQWLEKCHNGQGNPGEGTSAREIHQKAMATLARLTAESVEQFHKAAELLLVLEKRTPSEEAKLLLEMTTLLSSQVTTAATRFSECLNVTSENSENPDAVASLITNVFYEASNSSSYIQEAFQLLVPVLQVGLTTS